MPDHFIRSVKIKANPVSRWTAASLVSDADQKDNRIFAKRKSSGRIDGVVAVAMSIGASELQLADVSDHDGFFNSPIMVGV